MQTITLDIPQTIWNANPNIVLLKKRLFEYLVLDEYQKGTISLREGAKLLGLTYEGFMDFLGSHQMSFINASREELQESYERFSAYISKSECKKDNLRKEF